MNTVEWARNAMLLCTFASLVMARWSAIQMAREINRLEADGERISMKWWPNYKDRRVLRRYRFAIPDGRLHLVYMMCMAGALVFLAVGILL